METAVRLGYSPDIRQEEQKLILENILGLEPAFRQLILSDTQGLELIKVSRLSKLTPFYLTEESKHDLLFEAGQGKRYISPVSVNKVTSEPLMVMAVPVVDIFGDPKGVLMAEVNLKFMWDLVREIKIGEKGLAYVVDKKGDLIAFHDIARVLKGENLRHLEEVNEFINGDQSVYQDRADVSKGIYGTLVVTNHEDLDAPDWAVVIEMPVQEAYKGAIRMFKVALLTVFFSIILAVALSIYFSKRITRPILKLRDTAIKIGKGHLDMRIEVNTKNEIGDLARAFNEMAGDLQQTTVSIEVLKSEQKKFNDVVINSGDWIWEVDAEGRYIYSSPLVENIMGYKQEEILGRYFYDFFHPSVKEALKNAALKIFSQKKKLINMLNYNIRKDGCKIILETNATPIIGNNGSLLGYRGIDRDVTERVKAEEIKEQMIKELKDQQELLKRQKQEAEDSRRAIKNVAEDLKESKDILEYQKTSLESINKELDDFTYIVSHDLKEPLRSIDAYSKFVVDDYKDKLGEEGKHYLERVRANTERMKRLIEDLLEISRLKKRGGVIEEVEAADLVEEAKMRLEYSIKQKGVKIEIRDSLPRIFCDRIRLAEVFLNLISNAVKFNDKQNPVIEIGYNDEGNLHKFYVKDNGIGIKDEYFEKIFEIFQRLGKREDVEGTGAGLTIVKKIIQIHKGNIWLESKYGEGSVFYFTIPKEKSAILGKKLIGEILLEKKLITKEDIKKALEEQKKADRPERGGHNDGRT
jgi:PAS domain S-box-containing protein